MKPSGVTRWGSAEVPQPNRSLRRLFVVVQWLIHVQLFVTACTAARQAPLSVGFSREYWSGVPCPPAGDPPDRGMEPGLPHWQADSLPSTRRALQMHAEYKQPTPTPAPQTTLGNRLRHFSQHLHDSPSRHLDGAGSVILPASWPVSVLCDLPGLCPNLPKFTSIESVIPPNHLVLCRPLLLPAAIFPSIRVFSSESSVMFGLAPGDGERTRKPGVLRSSGVAKSQTRLAH